MTLDLHALALIAAVLAGLFITNIGALIGSYISLRIAQARFEVKVDNLEKDLNNLGAMFRETLKKEKES